MSVDTFTSAGRFFLSVVMVESRASVSSSVGTEGCFVTVIITAGLPLYEAVPMRGIRFPTFTSAIASRRMGAPEGDFFTTAFPISRVSLVDNNPLMIYSLPYS